MNELTNQARRILDRMKSRKLRDKSARLWRSSLELIAEWDQKTDEEKAAAAFECELYEARKSGRLGLN